MTRLKWYEVEWKSNKNYPDVKVVFLNIDNSDKNKTDPAKKKKKKNREEMNINLFNILTSRTISAR